MTILKGSVGTYLQKRGINIEKYPQLLDFLCNTLVQFGFNSMKLVLSKEKDGVLLVVCEMIKEEITPNIKLKTATASDLLIIITSDDISCLMINR